MRAEKSWKPVLKGLCCGRGKGAWEVYGAEVVGLVGLMMPAWSEEDCG